MKTINNLFRFHFSFLGCFVLLLGLFSCASTPDSLQEPEVSLKEIALADATLSDTIMIFRLNINNPNPVTLKVDGVDFDISLRGKPIHSGSINSDLRIRSESFAELEIPFKVIIQDVFDSEILALHERIVDYHIKATIRAGSMRVPFEQQGKTAVIPE